MTMRFLRNIPIKQKLTFITMLASSVALLLACVAFATYEQVRFRDRVVRDLSIIAEMTSANSTVGLTFNDVSSVEQTLNSLRAHPHIARACVYDKNGRPFAIYQRADLKGRFVPPPAQADGHRFGESQLDLFQTISFSGETVGSIYIESDLRELRERIWRYALIVVALLLAGSLVALLLAARLQRIISRPIADLAATAAAVATNRNYAVRVVKHGEDEIGRLFDGFNEMLAHIQERDTALQTARDNLEMRVEERTAELLNEIAERKQADEALRVQEERTRLIVDKAFDAIISADTNGTIIGWNSQAEKTFGWSQSEAVGRALVDTIIPAEHRAAYQAGMERFLANGDGPLLHKRMEVSGLHKDGHEVPIELAITPIRVEGGHVFNAFVRDISERKHAEEQLAATHRQLMDASRRAGMAEVATGVLHNVGNVLNSINVSATLVTDALKKSRTASLSKVAALLREQPNPAEFFAADPRAKPLPGYLVQLADHLVAEQNAALAEVDSLRKNIDHIKDIVAMQQSYAKVSGVTEVVQAVELVEDALRMNAAALVRHDIEVQRDFAEVPPLSLDKHKVLQILVNLIRNAKYACQESPRPDKRLTLRVAESRERGAGSGEPGAGSRLSVRIEVIDNGVGIAQENLTRIFAHGFTTRQNGHGFGLHSGALAARELGGQLLAHSDGPGLGATFTLHLPIEPVRGEPGAGSREQRAEGREPAPGSPLPAPGSPRLRL